MAQNFFVPFDRVGAAKIFPRIVCSMLHAASRTGMGPSMGADLALERRRPVTFFTVLEKTVGTVTGDYCEGFFAA